RVLFGFVNLEAVTGTPCLPQLQRGWKQVFLPGVRAHCIAEISVVWTFLQPIRSGSLTVCPANWQILGRLNRSVDDCLLLDAWADHLETFLRQQADQVFQPILG